MQCIHCMGTYWNPKNSILALVIKVFCADVQKVNICVLLYLCACVLTCLLHLGKLFICEAFVNFKTAVYDWARVMPDLILRKIADSRGLSLSYDHMNFNSLWDLSTEGASLFDPEPIQLVMEACENGRSECTGVIQALEVYKECLHSLEQYKISAIAECFPPKSTDNNKLITVIFDDPSQKTVWDVLVLKNRLKRNLNLPADALLLLAGINPELNVLYRIVGHDNLKSSCVIKGVQIIDQGESCINSD